MKFCSGAGPRCWYPPKELHAGLVELGVERVVGGDADGHAVRVALSHRQRSTVQTAARHRAVEAARLSRGCVGRRGDTLNRCTVSDSL